LKTRDDFWDQTRQYQILIRVQCLCGCNG